MSAFDEKEPQESNDNERKEYYLLMILLIIGSILCFIRLLLGLTINGAILLYLFAGEKK